MADILPWLICLWALTLVGFPIASSATGLGRLADKGWAVSRPLALLLLMWLTWVGGAAGVIPNTAVGIASVAVLLAAVAAGLAWRQRLELADFFRRRWAVVVVTEVLFLALFAVWALVISESPAVNHTEKPMDFAILNAIANSGSFPPEDQWLSGHSIAYYYGGHQIAAMLTTLTGTDSSVGYNLAMATIPALFGAGVLGLVYNVLRLAGSGMWASLLGGVASALGIGLLGNLSGLVELAYVRGIGGDGLWGWVAIKGLEAPAGGNGWLPDGFWWWWRGTRVIDTLAAGGASLDYTITEFPFFSFLLGDLHAHVSALPYLMLTLALALAMLVASVPPGMEWLRTRPWEAGTLALTLGALAFINAWDFPVYLCIIGMVAAIRWMAAQDRPPTVTLLGPVRDGGEEESADRGGLVRALGQAGILVAGLAAAGIVLFLPFYVSFDSQTSGILPVVGPASRPLLFLIVMGVPAAFAGGFVARAALDSGWPTGDRRVIAIAVGSFGVAIFAAWLVAVGVRMSISGDGLAVADNLVAGRLWLAVPLLFMGCLAAYCALAMASWRRRGQWVVFGLALAAAGYFLLGGAELFHIADQFGNRMNTVFKFHYQAWLLLGIAGAIGMYYILVVPLRHAWVPEWALVLAGLRIVWMAVVAVLLMASAYYPAGAVLERTGWLSGTHSWGDNTLSGLDFLRESSPGEYEGIVWLKTTAGPGRIVEAIGGDYQGYGGVSAATGRATPLSWEGHERQWRGVDVNPELERRRGDVDAIYTSGDGEEVRRLLRHHGVRWVIAGPNERSAYGGEALDRMVKWADDDWLAPAFESRGMTIYEVLDER